jgi:hypothetical protein
MPNGKSLAVLLLALAIAAPACGGGDCDQAYEMMKKCSKSDRDIPKDKFISACQEALKDPEKKEEAQADLACMKQDSCEKATECRQAQRGKRRAKKVTEAIGAGNWKDAFDDCTLSKDYFSDETFKAECTKVFANVDKLKGDDLSTVGFRCRSGEEIKKVSPEFEKACKSLSAGQLDAAQKAAIAARDAGKNDYKACSDLKRASEGGTAEATAAALKLCDEIAASEDAKKAATEARANIAAKKTSVPITCQFAAEKLAKVESEWAKKTLDDVYKACYVELGAFVIEEKGKDAKYGCPYEITKIKEAITKHDLATKFPELAETMKKLPAKCQK